MPSSIDLAARLSDVIAAQQEILSYAGDADHLEKLAVAKAAEIAGGEGAILDIVDGEDLVCHAASGAASADAGTRAPAQRSLPAAAIQDGRAVRCDDVELDPRVDAGACLAIGIRSMISAPLLQNAGALTVFSSSVKAFDDLDAYTLQLLAGMTSSAITIARELRERRASEERYRLLFERNIAGVFRSTRDGRILDCNDALASYLGYDSRDEFLSLSTWDIYRTRADRQTILDRLDREVMITNHRIIFRRKDGSEVVTIMNISLVPSPEGDAHLLGTIVAE